MRAILVPAVFAVAVTALSLPSTPASGQGLPEGRRHWRCRRALCRSSRVARGRRRLRDRPSRG